MLAQLSQEDIQYLIDTALKAGAEIQTVYNNKELFNTVDFKSDDSPLTLADQRSHEVIDARLKSRFPQIPVLSEEGSQTPFTERSAWTQCWLVDPLDGTKEFIKRNGEFTVNIALIQEHKPVFGVIYLPEKDTLYWGGAAQGSFKKQGAGEIQKLTVNKKTDNLTAVGSRSHTGDEDKAMLEKYPVTNFVSSGSSIKFCLVAEGTADLYFRGLPTMEWDTAAGQAIVEGAGGTVHMGEVPMHYNRENLRNSSFLCKGF